LTILNFLRKKVKTFTLRKKEQNESQEIMKNQLIQKAQQYFTIPCAGRFLNFWLRDFMAQYIAEIAANLDKFARSSNELGRKRCR
jgi:hypothetical protein